MTGKETKAFFKEKFKQSLQKDMIFWISLVASVAFAVVRYQLVREWYGNFMAFLRANWSVFAFWVGMLFLLTRNFMEVKDLKSHHLDALFRVFLLVLVVNLPLTAIVLLPVVVVRSLSQSEKKGALDTETGFEDQKPPITKTAMASMICSALSMPLLFGITLLQEWLISSGALNRMDSGADTGVGFLFGVVFAVAGMIFWRLSRKGEGRNVWNFWAMRLIVVNVILAPFALLFILAFTIMRSK